MVDSPRPDAPPAAPQSSSTGPLLALLGFAWLCAVAGCGSLVAWGGVGISRASGLVVGSFVWPLGQLGLALALLVVIAPLGYARRADPRSPFRLWLVGALLFLVAAPLKAITLSQMQVSALAQLVVAAPLVVVGIALGRGVARRRTARGGGIGLAAALALWLLLPWLLWGALGSPLDLLLSIALAALSGIGSARLLGAYLPRLDAGAGRNALLGGFAASSFLALVALALARDGQILLLPLTLWAVGWVSEPLWRRGGRTALAVAIGGAALGPLALADPNELGLLLNLGGPDALWWLLRAAALAAAIALVVAVVVAIAGRRERGGSRVPLAFAGMGLVAGLVAYLALGQPGFHGDRLFVLMREQADLSTLPTTGEREARLVATYSALVTHADRTQEPLRARLDRVGVAYTPYYLVNAIEVRGGLLHRLWLEQQPGVERVLDSPTLRPLPEIAPTAFGAEAAPDGVPWNLSMIGAERVWAEFGARGEGIILGQSDSGVQGDHPELADGFRDDGYGWFDPWNGTTEPTDIGGHGTHTAGTVLGNTVGVAPDAEWIGCVNLARNLANPALYLDCMQFMLAPFPLGGDPLRDGDPTRAAHVLNNSWGCPPEEGCDPTVLESAVEALRHAGIFVVASAGNEGAGGCSTINDPIALYDASFTVGAVNRSGDLAPFSSLGPVTVDGSNRTKPDLVAPGVGILSSFPNGTYSNLEGTSMAGPHVAGAVALLWSAAPELIGDIERTEALLIESAAPYEGGLPDCGDRNTVGHGLLDIYEAVRLARGER